MMGEAQFLKVNAHSRPSSWGEPSWRPQPVAFTPFQSSIAPSPTDCWPAAYDIHGTMRGALIFPRATVRAPSSFWCAPPRFESVCVHDVLWLLYKLIALVLLLVCV